MKSEHDDIKNKKTIDEIFNNFENLLSMCLLFDKESDYYKFSGVVTAALLDYEENGKISILAIKTNDNWYTFKYTREDLIKMFNHCDAFVGETLETSFLLEKI